MQFLPVFLAARMAILLARVKHILETSEDPFLVETELWSQKRTQGVKNVVKYNSEMDRINERVRTT